MCFSAVGMCCVVLQGASVCCRDVLCSFLPGVFLFVETYRAIARSVSPSVGGCTVQFCQVYFPLWRRLTQVFPCVTCAGYVVCLAMVCPRGEVLGMSRDLLVVPSSSQDTWPVGRWLLLGLGVLCHVFSSESAGLQ